MQALGSRIPAIVNCWMEIRNKYVEDRDMLGVFGWALVFGKPVVSCGLWKSYCELQAARNLKAVW